MLSGRKTSLVIFILACLGALFTAGIFLHKRLVHEPLLSDLRGFIITVDPEDLSTRDLRIHQYALLAQFDPFFSLAGSDLEDLTIAISELLDTRSQFLPYYEKSEQETLFTSLYPASFLTSVVATESARRDLVQKPTKEHARIYHKKLAATLRAYIDDAKLLNAALNLDTPRHIGFWNGTTNSAFVRDALVSVEAHAQKLLAKERARYRCLSPLPFSCDLFKQATEKRLSQTIQIPPPVQSIPAQIRENREILSKALAYDYPWRLSRLGEDKASPASSVIVSDSTHCRPKYGRGYFTVWWSAADFLEGETASIAILDELYFDDLARMDDGFSQALSDAGLSYAFQKLNPYLCIELGYDYGTLHSAHYIWSELKKTPVFSDDWRDDGSMSVYVRELHELESRIRSQQFVYTEEIDAFAHLAELELFTNGRAHLRNILGIEKFSALEHYVGVWNSKSVWQENIITKLTSLTPATVGVLDRVEMPLGIFFLARSYMSFLYFLGNTSVVPEPPVLMQIRKEIETENFDIVTYSRTLSKFYTPAEIVPYILHSLQVTDQVTRERARSLQ